VKIDSGTPTFLILHSWPSATPILYASVLSKAAATHAPHGKQNAFVGECMFSPRTPLGPSLNYHGLRPVTAHRTEWAQGAYLD